MQKFTYTATQECEAKQEKNETQAIDIQPDDFSMRTS
jgi:hypothetical protein